MALTGLVMGLLIVSSGGSPGGEFAAVQVAAPINTSPSAAVPATISPAAATPGPIAAGGDSVDAMAAPLVAAHRGGFFRGQGDLARMLQTLSQGDADIIEIDLRSTSDGQVVVSHDPHLESRTTCAGAIAEQTYQQIAACRIRGASGSLPLFSQVLEAAHGHAIVDAEFKTLEALDPAIGIVVAADARDRVYFQIGNDRRRYELVRAYDARLNLQFKVVDDDDLAWALQLHDPHLRLIEMDRDYIDPARIARVHDAGMLVSENTWRYQFTEERFGSSCTRAFSAGVDVAVTNNPRSCSRQRHSRPFPASYQWVYSAIGRPHVRNVARRAMAGVQKSVVALRLLASQF